MNFVYLSPHCPPNYYLFAVNLRSFGANVLGLADEPYDRLSQELKRALTEYYYVRDMHNYDDLVRALGYFTHRYGKLDRIDSHNEYWLETEARLRTDFNLFGFKIDDMPRVKCKSEMKEVFKRAGVVVAPGKVMSAPDQAREFVSEVGYPVVAKPDVGVGAAQTWKLAGPADLETYLAGKPPVDYFLEEFVDGRIVTYDGLTDRDGRVVFEASLQYSRGIMEVVNEDGDVWYHCDREIADDLRDAGRLLVEAFGVRERFFHFEFFRLADGRLLALEVNVRPPGGLTMDMWNYQNDADLYRAWADLLMRGRVQGSFDRPWYVAYVGRKHRHRYVLSLEQVRDRFRDLRVHDEPVNDVFSAAIGNHGFVLRAPTLAPLADAAAAIQQVA